MSIVILIFILKVLLDFAMSYLSYELDTTIGVLLCIYEEFKVNFTVLSCCLSMPFAKENTLMQETNTLH